MPERLDSKKLITANRYDGQSLIRLLHELIKIVKFSP